MGMDGFKNGKDGRLKFLRDFVGWYDSQYPEDSIREIRYWPDEKDKDVIWWNEGQGYWNSSKVGEDVEICQK